MDIRNILGKLDQLSEGTMSSAKTKPTGPKFVGKMKGTDPASAAKDKYVGGMEESIFKELEHTLQNRPARDLMKEFKEFSKHGIAEAKAATASFRAGNAKRANLNSMSDEERRAYDKEQQEKQRKRDDARLERERQKLAAKKGVAEGSDELYQKAIRKYTQRVANDYLGGGNEYLYGAGGFDSEMFGVDPKQAQQDFKSLFPQYVKKLQSGEQGVAEGWTKLPNGDYQNSHTGVRTSKPPMKKKRGEKTGAEWDAIEKAKQNKEQGVAEGSLNEFAPNGDNRPDADYEVYLLDPKQLRNRKLDIMGDPLYKSDNLAHACSFIHKFWNSTKQPICVYQPKRGYFRDYYMDPAVNWMDEYGNDKEQGVAGGSLNEFSPDDGGDDDGDDDRSMEATFTIFSKGKMQTGTVIIFPGVTTDVEYHINGKIYIKNDMDDVYDYDDFITNAADYIQEIIQLKGDGHHFVEQGVAEGWKDKVAGAAIGAAALGSIGALQNIAPNTSIQGHQAQLASSSTIPDTAKLVTDDKGKKVYVWAVTGSNPKSAGSHKVLVYRPAEQVKEQGVAEMDSQKPQGRYKSDGTRSHSTYGSRDNYNLGDPETTLGPDRVLLKKDVAKKASTALDKAFSDAHKKPVSKPWSETRKYAEQVAKSIVDRGWKDVSDMSDYEFGTVVGDTLKHITTDGSIRVQLMNHDKDFLPLVRRNVEHLTRHDVAEAVAPAQPGQQPAAQPGQPTLGADVSKQQANQAQQTQQLAKQQADAVKKAQQEKNNLQKGVNTLKQAGAAISNAGQTVNAFDKVDANAALTPNDKNNIASAGTVLAPIMGNQQLAGKFKDLVAQAGVAQKKDQQQAQQAPAAQQPQAPAPAPVGTQK